MNRTAVGLGRGWTKAAGLAAVALAGGLLAAGCRAGGGGGGGDATGISATDEHANVPINATVVIPDGAGDDGQINYVDDVDWFRFRGIEGVGYALQIHGFPTDPSVRPDLDLNGDGRDQLQAQIVGPDGTTQLVNSSAGQLGDITPAGFDSPRTGDSRFFWICPTTQDYFFMISHRRNGIGAYRFRLASSQFTTIRNLDFDIDFQTGGRFVVLREDDGTLIFSGFVVGGVNWPYLEFIESLAVTDIGDIQAFVFPLIIPIGGTEPRIPRLHAHVGFPNVFFPENSVNLTVGFPPHPTILDLAFSDARGLQPDAATGVLTGEATLRMAGGLEGRVPVTMEYVDEYGNASPSGTGGKFTFHFGDAVVTSERGAEPILTAGLLRTITGRDWYFDVHPQFDMELDPLPVAVSRPLADMYEMFETPLVADSSNVVLPDGTRLPEAQRGGQPFNIYYDSSLKLFQVATEIYAVLGPGNWGVFSPDYAPFVGDIVKVHAGAPGTTGPVIIDFLGTPMPVIRAPRSASPPFSRSTSVAPDSEEPEGFRQPIRQLTDAEADDLRAAFYDEGFYVEVTDPITGEPLVRAEGFLGISIFPFLEPCSFPPCSGAAGAEKQTKGSVSFASGLVGEGPVELYANGNLLGSLGRTVTPEDLPACGLDGDDRTLAAELWPGTYYWHAHGKNGNTWDGHFTVTGESCNLVVISPDDLKQD